MTEQLIRILLIDDDKVDRMAIERLLREKGLPYDLTTAASFAEGIEKLDKNKFDLVLTDYELGDGKGLDILKKNKETPKIIITGSGTEEVAARAVRMGAYDYLIKDPERNYLEVLPTTVQNVLKRKQMEEERERLIKELQEALAQVKTLGGLLPICSSCKKIRDDKGYWNIIESYIEANSEAEFTHSICPGCAKKLYPELYDEKED